MTTGGLESNDSGRLGVGGVPVAELAVRAGRTPFYVYDRALVTRRVAELRSILPASVELHYAVKANPMPALVGHLAGLVDGMDVASGGELLAALNAGMPGGRVSFAGPGKTREELAQALAARALVHVESGGEAERLAALSAELGIAAKVAVRINPEFELKMSGMKMGGGPKPFGTDAEQVPELLQHIAKLGLAFEGFHLYAGSQNLRSEAIIDAQNRSVDLMLALAAYAPAPVRRFNLGGGFGIPYFAGDKPLDVAPIAENLKRLSSHVQAVFPDARLILELGRYLVGEAGFYVTRIVDRKISRGHVFLVVDGGMHHHLAASGNLGQVIRKNYPVQIDGPAVDAVTETVSIVGPLCTPLDILADHVEVPQAEPGDLVVILQSGAYGLTASPQPFLSHPPPGELLL